MLKKLINPDSVFVLIILLMSAALLFLPTGFEQGYYDDSYISAKGLVLSTDNRYVIQRGIVKTGVQALEIEVLGRKFKGELESPACLIFIIIAYIHNRGYIRISVFTPILIFLCLPLYPICVTL